jgi:hypothetical protein
LSVVFFFIRIISFKTSKGEHTLPGSFIHSKNRLTMKN